MRFEAGWDLGALGLAEAWCPPIGTSFHSCSMSRRWKELSLEEGIPEPGNWIRASFKMLGQWIMAGLSWG